MGQRGPSQVLTWPSICILSSLSPEAVASSLAPCCQSQSDSSCHIRVTAHVTSIWVHRSPPPGDLRDCPPTPPHALDGVWTAPSPVCSKLATYKWLSFKKTSWLVPRCGGIHICPPTAPTQFSIFVGKMLTEHLLPAPRCLKVARVKK